MLSKQAQEILEMFRQIKVSEKGGKRAPYKPLLLLYALGRCSRQEGNEIPYRDLERDLKGLFAKFGPTRPHEPFCRLTNTKKNKKKLWFVEGLKCCKAKDYPKRRELWDNNPAGGLRSEVYDALVEDKQLLNKVVELLREEHFDEYPSKDIEDILDAVGIALDDSTGERDADPVSILPSEGRATMALFINGIYDQVLTEIMAAQQMLGGGEFFLQPYKGQAIGMLKAQRPSTENPIRLYMSTTENLSQICYTAEVIRWEDKRELSEQRRRKVREYLKSYQHGEVALFTGAENVGKKAVNLITIRSLVQHDTLHSTSLLRKAKDGLPLKKRTRSGGWSEVYDLGNLVDLPIEAKEQYDSDLLAAIEASKSLPDVTIHKRLAKASKEPEKIQVVSVGYRRNPYVIIAVLRRAEGICEECRNKAPFQRRSDGTPYLEVHHKTRLSKGGEDTVDNAVALCPNCHREAHYGG